MTAPAYCHHCGEPLPEGRHLVARIEGQDRPVCCNGCRAAAEWIVELGLTDYYQLRSKRAARPASEDSDHTLWQRDVLQRHVVQALDTDCSEVCLLVDGLRCAGCIWLIERALMQVSGVRQVSVNGINRRARVLFDPARTSLPDLLEALTRVGYRPLPLDTAALDDLRRAESRDALKRLLVAGFGMMQAMMFAAALWLGAFEEAGPATRDLFRWFGFLVATPVVLYSARPFFAGARRSLAARQLGMDVPVALAIALIYLASLVETWRGGHEVYFESVSMFVFFLLTGRYLEMRARHRSTDSSDALSRMAPALADRRTVEGHLERVATLELQVGDVVHVAEGESVPADGELLTTGARVDESLISGESNPILKSAGESLKAGSVVIDGPLELRVQQVGNETFLAQMALLATRAHTQRPRLTRDGERATTRFVLRVLSLTLITAVGWLLVDPSRVLSATLAVLVVSCPCAFALAVPAALTRALGVLAKRGVLVVKPDALEDIAQIDTVVFDKTGTLTEPVLAGFADQETEENREALRLAAALAQGSRHPVSQALVVAARQRALMIPPAEALQSHPGLGMEGQVEGRHFRLGRADFALPGQKINDDQCDFTVLSEDGRCLMAFQLQEQPRSDALACTQALQAEGVSVGMASGDSPMRVQSIAGALSISVWYARQLPADKLAKIEALHAEGHRVLVVGDGSNDAPVLAGADVSVALSSGTGLAQAYADILLCSGRLMSLLEIRAVAMQTRHILRQNQRWALFYNLAAMPLAAFGFVPPWLAALGMSASSLFVVLNALRIGQSFHAGPEGESMITTASSSMAGVPT